MNICYIVLILSKVIKNLNIEVIFKCGMRVKILYFFVIELK